MTDPPYCFFSNIYSIQLEQLDPTFMSFSKHKPPANKKTCTERGEQGKRKQREQNQARTQPTHPALKWFSPDSRPTLKCLQDY